MSGKWINVHFQEVEGRENTWKVALKPCVQFLSLSNYIKIDLTHRWRVSICDDHTTDTAAPAPMMFETVPKQQRV